MAAAGRLRKAIALAARYAAISLPMFATRAGTIRGVAAISILSGVVGTAAIEVGSTQWLERWTYGPLMPVHPIFGIGLSPLVQWIVVPALGLFLVRRHLAEFLRG